MKKIFLIVLDSFGIGEAPDAHLFGDAGANTLKRISASNAFLRSTLSALRGYCSLISLGMGNFLTNSIVFSKYKYI